jgi:glycosyltransferase involved in cell wall biosynthesis
MPLFSIIIPTLNSSNTLSEALESITHQLFTDFEILIIDGISTDNTIEIANSFCDHRIRVFSERDNGIYDAMNKGIRLAKGDWLYFLGSDDRLFNSMILLRIYETISENKFDVLYGDVNSLRFNGRYCGEVNDQRILSQNLCHQSIFFKKSVFKNIGFFNLKYKSHADWDHNMRWLLSKNISKAYINLVIAEYADGGYSSLNYDLRFEKDMILNYLVYGKKQFSITIRIKLLKQELRRSHIKRDTSQFLKIVVHIPRIILGI